MPKRRRRPDTINRRAPPSLWLRLRTSLRAGVLDVHLKETTRGSDNGAGVFSENRRSSSMRSFSRRGSYVVQGLLTRAPIEPENSFPVVFDHLAHSLDKLRYVTNEIFRGLDFEDRKRVVVSSIAICLSASENFSDIF
ncbi:hypothetical protein GGP52_002813 [Salinibacter ruber]|nr:hypothetical protein [Salinibacter ruber]MCS4149101.1 hypothetical protein [Salinibacter ruber]